MSTGTTRLDDAPEPSSEAPRPAADTSHATRDYTEALAVFQAHHDRPGSVTEAELAAALRPYLMRWDTAIHWECRSVGLSADDARTVTQDVAVEFFRTRIVSGVFDPSRSEFAIFKDLARRRAIDRYRHNATRKERMNGVSPTDDPYIDAPRTASAEDQALDSTTYEEAARSICRAARLDRRETALIVARFVDGIDDWDLITTLGNAAAPPPPVGTGRMRNILTEAKKKLRIQLEQRGSMTEGGSAR